MDERVLVLSDIEGQYAAFENLLLAGKVMDKNQQWTFGKGHLVLLGDMMDRGDQVMEVLQLIRKLEVEALKAGGQVHYLMGNHEVMNLSGDWRYVNKKYLLGAGVLKPEYADLLSPASKTGQWLRSKNIVEKIGDVLFVHGGISPEINAAAMDITAMNSLAKKYIDLALYYRNPHLIEKIPAEDRENFELLFDPVQSSPFWYRGYYRLDGDHFTTGNAEATIDSTLQKFNVKHIVTGHSIVADSISSHYNGKVFNTDVEHAAGHSEALLIEGGEFYRVLPTGERIALKPENNHNTIIN